MDNYSMDNFGMDKDRKKLHLNRDDKKFLGVCAGIADYLQVASWAVRLVFVVAVFMGAWVLVPLYFAAYFFLNSGSADAPSGIRESSAFKHFRNVDYKKKLYRNMQEARFQGVCAGIADYLEVDVTLVRLATLALFFTAGPIPWLAYFAACFVLDKKPPELIHSEESYRPHSTRSGYNRSRSRTRTRASASRNQRTDLQDCARRFSNLQSRLVRMEAYVTSKQYKLRREFKDLS